MNEKLEELPNIGSKLAGRLRAIGIETPDQLRVIGSVAAIMRMNDALNQGCYSSLYALEGAIRGIRWHLLSREDREGIKIQLDQAYFSRK